MRQRGHTSRLPAEKRGFTSNRTRAATRNTPFPLPETHTNATAHDGRDRSCAERKRGKNPTCRYDFSCRNACPTSRQVVAERTFAKNNDVSLLAVTPFACLQTDSTGPAKRLVVSGERETGLEPATACLEGRNSTTELLPPVHRLGRRLQHPHLHYICVPCDRGIGCCALA